MANPSMQNIKLVIRLAALFALPMIFMACRDDATSSEEIIARGAESEGFILRTGEGEALQNGLVVKISPSQGSEASILVEQTFPRGGSTPLHLHEQGDELFYVLSGVGKATLNGTTEVIGSGDVIFVPRNAAHRIMNLVGEEPLRVVFFMDSPELVHEFRAIHERITSQPDKPITPEERSEIAARIGGGKVIDLK